MWAVPKTAYSSQNVVALQRGHTASIQHDSILTARYDISKPTLKHRNVQWPGEGDGRHEKVIPVFEWP